MSLVEKLLEADPRKRPNLEPPLPKRKPGRPKQLRGDSAQFGPKIPAEAMNILHKLKRLGLGVKANDHNVVHLHFGDEEPRGEEKPSVNISVYPTVKWMRAVRAKDEDTLKQLWQSRYSPQGDAFEQVMTDNQYELGSSGGGNFDCSKEYPEAVVTFCFWGNPWHI